MFFNLVCFTDSKKIGVKKKVAVAGVGNNKMKYSPIILDIIRTTNGGVDSSIASGSDKTKCQQQIQSISLDSKAMSKPKICLSKKRLNK